MTKVDIFSGFLGAGKTTLIKKLIEEAYVGEKIVLIENEFGEIGIDGGFLQDSGVKINEMNSGCICCSLVGDFGKALESVITEYEPDRILIEPSGVGKLSDVITAVVNLHNEKIMLNGFTTVVDAKKCKMYMKNFGEFFNNQIEHASSIILSHTDSLSQEKLDKCVEMIREHNENASIVTTPWTQLDGKQILDTMESKNTILSELEHLEDLVKEAHEHDHHDHDHHEHHHDECECGHEHHHHHDECECDCEHDHHHEHHHHDHEEHSCECGHNHEHHHEHEHHHHDDECSCGCGHEHHHHHADEVFTSIGIETSHKFSKDQIVEALTKIQDEKEYGQVLRAKGIVEGDGESWIHFDYVPGEPDVRDGSASVTGMICVIGADINESKIRELFEL